MEENNKKQKTEGEYTEPENRDIPYSTLKNLADQIAKNFNDPKDIVHFCKAAKGINEKVCHRKEFWNTLYMKYWKVDLLANDPNQTWEDIRYVFLQKRKFFNNNNLINIGAMMLLLSHIPKNKIEEFLKIQNHVLHRRFSSNPDIGIFFGKGGIIKFRSTHVAGKGMMNLPVTDLSGEYKTILDKAMKKYYPHVYTINKYQPIFGAIGTDTDKEDKIMFMIHSCLLIYKDFLPDMFRDILDICIAHQEITEPLLQPFFNKYQPTQEGGRKVYLSKRKTSKRKTIRKTSKRKTIRKRGRSLTSSQRRRRKPSLRRQSRTKK